MGKKNSLPSYRQEGCYDLRLPEEVTGRRLVFAEKRASHDQVELELQAVTQVN